MFEKDFNIHSVRAVSFFANGVYQFKQVCLDCPNNIHIDRDKVSTLFENVTYLSRTCTCIYTCYCTLPHPLIKLSLVTTLSMFT